VQPHVDEIGRHVLEQRPRPGRVGHHPGDFVTPQHRDELRRREALVPHFHRVPQPQVVQRLQADAPLRPLVVGAGDPQRCFGRARQDREELLEQLGVEAHHRRELPEDRPELVA